MSSITNSAAEPSYLTRLALSAAPFNNTIQADSFFHGEQIEQRLNLLFHLLRASDKVPCVVGVEGGGKSTLLTQLQHDAGDELRIVRVNADSSLTATNLMMSCLQAFGIDESEIAQTSNYQVVLKNRLQRLCNLNIRPILLLDNADQVSPDVISIIVESLSWESEDGFLLQAVLTARSVMPEWAKLHGRSQRVDLPTLTEQELPLYLMHRLVAVGYLGEPVFSDKDIKQFYRHSAGSPARVNQLAHQKLLGIGPKQYRFTFSFLDLRGLLKWLGVVLLAISLLLLLVFQQQINALFSDSGEALTSQPEILSYSEVDEQLATVVIGEDKLTSSEQAEREELTSLIATLSEESGPVNAASKELAEPIESAPLIELVEDTPQSVVPVPLINKEEWIQQQKGSDYTFQLMGSWDHDEVIEFIDKYALSDDTAEFQSLRNGRVWYALIYGVYTDKKSALKASKKWPAPLNTLPSWLRRFDSVQKQIKGKAQAQ